MVLIAVEVRHLHARILDQPAALTPLVFCGLAILLIPACTIRTTRALRSAAITLFAVGVLVGVVGVYFHTEFRIEPFQQLFTDERAAGAQPLAPLALTGLSAIGLLAARMLKALPAEKRAQSRFERAVGR
jgi:hypothetical protein